MQVMKVDELIPHKMNSYFFDDITGEPWMAFLQSIETSGVIEPIIATQDKVIVSGHQRIRACKKLGINEVAVEIRRFESDDEVLKQLIETNIRQRGIGNTNAVKLGRCIVELERIYGIKNGNNQHTERVGHNVQGSKTQEDLAKELEMSKKQMSRFKSLTDLIPELQDAVQSGQITATTAMGFVKKISPEEQKQLAEQIIGKEKVSGTEVNDMISKLKSRLSEVETENIALKNRKPEVKEVVREVVPSDYQAVKNKANAYDKETARLNQKLTDAYNERNELMEEIDSLKEQTAQATSSAKLLEGSIYFVAQCGSFVRDMGGYVWIADKIAELPERERADFMKAVDAIKSWAEVLTQNIERNM